ncbi:MAG: cytochrome P450 [Acidobacteriota bacterium]
MLNSIAAVTHADPYRYYADLVASKPIYYDEILKLWIASSAYAVKAVLSSDLCRVRPLAEPVPQALLGSPAASIFQHLIRMNDGQSHCHFKPAVLATLTSIDSTEVVEQSDKWAQSLLNEMGLKSGSRRLSDFAFQLSVYVIASLLGVPQDQLDQVALWVYDFVLCLAPTSSPEQIEQGKVAASHLLELFHSLLIVQRPNDGLLATLAWQAQRAGYEVIDGIIANGIGFLSQAYEATAGLIGNTLVTLAFHNDIYEQLIADLSLLHQVILEVLRYDPPVQNTRRFLARSGIVAGQEMQQGDTVLVVLAAANRDPLVNPNPEQFDIFRRDRQTLTFGIGAHTCPGEVLATTIAEAGVKHLIISGIDLKQLTKSLVYRPSVNTRIPLFTNLADK